MRVSVLYPGQYRFVTVGFPSTVNFQPQESNDGDFQNYDRKYKIVISNFTGFVCFFYAKIGLYRGS